MMIRSLSRSSGRPWWSLLRYYSREAAASRHIPAFGFNLRSRAMDFAAVVAEFEALHERTPARKRGVVCFHEILSFSHKDAPSDADLRALAMAYLERRAPANLAWLRIHRPEGRNPHVHIMLSASDLDGRRHALSRAQFADAKREVEELQRTDYPHLAHSLCAAQRSQTRALRRGEQEARRRASERAAEPDLERRPWTPGNRAARRAAVREAVLAALKANDRAALVDALARNGLHLYHTRSGRTAGVTDGKIRYRFKTLDLDGVLAMKARDWSRDQTQERSR